MAISSNYIVEYLLQYKELSLEKIGTFNVEQNAGEPTATVYFTYNKKAESSPGFIQFLSEKMNKPAVLVAQDLISYLDQARQLVNLHNPFIMEGLGYIHLDNEGKYALNATANAIDVIKESENQTITDMYAQSPIAAPSANYEKHSNNRQFWWWTFAVLVIAALAYGAYYLHSNQILFANNQPVDSTEEKQPSATAVVTPKTDTAKTVADSTKNTMQSVTKSNGFKFIIQTFVNVKNCDTRQAQLKEYHEKVGRDSITLNGKPLYRLFVIDSLAATTDTARIKDSLSRYYGHPVTIE